MNGFTPAGFRYVHSVAFRFYTLYGAKLPLGTANPLRPAYFPVYASSMSFRHPNTLLCGERYRFRLQGRQFV